MLNRLNQANKFALICSQLVVTSCKSVTEESYRPVALMEGGTKTCSRCITIDHKLLGEIRQLEYRPPDNAFLIASKASAVAGSRPQEGLLFQEGTQWRSHRAVMLDEAAIIAIQVEKAAQVAHGRGHRPNCDRRHLVLVHGNSC